MTGTWGLDIPVSASAGGLARRGTTELGASRFARWGFCARHSSSKDGLTCCKLYGCVVVASDADGGGRWWAFEMEGQNKKQRQPRVDRCQNGNCREHVALWTRRLAVADSEQNPLSALLHRRRRQTLCRRRWYPRLIHSSMRTLILRVLCATCAPPTTLGGEH